MKYSIGHFIKTMGPAKATATVNVVELSEEESFNDSTVTFIGEQIVKDNKFFLENMYFEGNQTFRLVLNFEYKGECKSFIAFPLYTKNCGYISA